MICPACATAADQRAGLEHHCLLTADDHSCTCQHRPALFPIYGLRIYTKATVG